MLKRLGSTARLLARNLPLLTIPIGFFLLVELAARAALPDFVFMTFFNRSSCLRRSWLLSQEFVPHCSGHMFPNTSFQTNALGLRDREVAEDGATRILAIGDSCTWGWGVPQDRAYPQVLERDLEQRFGAGRYRVINAGTPGFSTHGGLIYLRERGLALDPAIVLFGYGFNDQTTDGDDESKLATQRRLLLLLRVDDLLLDKLRFWQWARQRTSGRRRLDIEPRVSLAKYRRNLADIVQLARQHGAKPVMIDWIPDRPQSAYRRAALAAAEELAFPTIGYRGRRLDVIHPTQEGYAALAAEIAARLEALGYVR